MTASEILNLPYRPRCRWDAPPLSGGIDYQVLTGNQFRVLSLDGLTSQGALKCSLRTTSHSEVPTYTAISYTWNESDKIWYGESSTAPKPIWIDAKLIQVPDKVANILYLALQHGKRLVWIDTICINQSNAAEKSHQVAQMGRIYKEALDVLCFLNNPSAKTDALFDTIRLASAAPPSRYLHEITKGLAGLSKDNYWSRAWTLPEMVLAKTALVCCGWKIISLPEIVDLYNRGYDIESRDTLEILKTLGRGFPELLNIVRQGRDTMDGWESKLVTFEPQSGFLDVLRKCRGSHGCSDPRDLIYSRLSLCAEATKLVPYPDYTISVEELYKRFAANCILLTKSLEVLTFALNSSKQLPNWVPDWAASINHEWRHDQIGNEDLAPLLNDITWKEGNLPRISPCRNELTVQGKILARLDKGDRIDAIACGMTRFTPYRHAYAPSEIPRPGDVICVLKGCPSLVFLRPVDDDYVLVGRNKFVQGNLKYKGMHGNGRPEAFEALKSAGTIPEVVFKIR